MFHVKGPFTWKLDTLQDEARCPEIYLTPFLEKGLNYNGMC